VLVGERVLEGEEPLPRDTTRRPQPAPGRANALRGAPAGTLDAVAVDVDVIERVHPLSLDAYHRLVEAGCFADGPRVELIEGVVVSMSSRTPEHEAAVEWLAEWLRDAVAAAEGLRARVRVTGPLTLPDGSEPEPDLTVVRSGTPRPHHPASAELVVEVALSSVRIDRHAKARVYATAGIREYWVVDLIARCLVCHRAPVDGGYRDVATLGEHDRLSPLALPVARLTVGELLNASYDF
jgi:Uma2 family endonuclease